MAEIVGGCLCGQVRYSGTAEPMFTGVCHCKDCQKETGTAFNIVVAVPQAALSFRGSPKTYTQQGDSGQDVVRRFCPNCGSTITSEPAAMPGVALSLKRRMLPFRGKYCRLNEKSRPESSHNCRNKREFRLAKSAGFLKFCPVALAMSATTLLQRGSGNSHINDTEPN